MSSANIFTFSAQNLVESFLFRSTRIEFNATISSNTHRLVPPLSNESVEVRKTAFNIFACDLYRAMSRKSAIWLPISSDITKDELSNHLMSDSLIYSKGYCIIEIICEVLWIIFKLCLPTPEGSAAMVPSTSKDYPVVVLWAFQGLSRDDSCIFSRSI